MILFTFYVCNFKVVEAPFYFFHGLRKHFGQYNQSVMCSFFTCNDEEEGDYDDDHHHYYHH